MRIYYPINKEEPTPALPKGGSLNEAQYSLTTNRLTSNGRHPPPLGKGYGFLLMQANKVRAGESLARAIDEVASLVEEWGWGWVPVQADMLPA